MRSAKLHKGITIGNTTTYEVAKKHFELNKVEVMIKDTTGAVKEVRTITRNNHNEWAFRVSDEELNLGTEVHVTNAAGKVKVFDLKK